jgi:hypothetical protein
MGSGFASASEPFFSTTTPIDIFISTTPMLTQPSTTTSPSSADTLSTEPFTVTNDYGTSLFTTTT